MRASNNNSLSDNDTNINMPNIDSTSYSATSNIETPQNILVSATHTEISASPLPSPEILKGYAEIIPNSPERFMQIVEREQENRFKNDSVERDRIKGELALKQSGQRIAFALVLLFLIVGTILACIGQNVIAYVIFALTMIPIVGLFYRHK